MLVGCVGVGVVADVVTCNVLLKLGVGDLYDSHYSPHGDRLCPQSE